MGRTRDLMENTLAALADIMTPSQLREFVSLSADEIRNRAARIQLNASKHDFTAVADDAHALIGVAGNLGATELTEALRGLRAAADAKQPRQVTDHGTEVQVASAAVLRRLERWLSLVAGDPFTPPRRS